MEQGGTMTDDAAVCIDNREDGIDFPTSAEDDGMDGMDGMDDSISVVPLGRTTE
jgi:hypothetical protein